MAKNPTVPKPRPNQPRQPARAVLQQEERHEIFIGPLPHPDILRQYNALSEGFAERLLVMTEQEAEYRRLMSQRALTESAAEVRRGQLYGLVIGVAGLSSAVATAYFNQPTVASILGGGTVLGLVSTFILGRMLKPH